MLTFAGDDRFDISSELFDSVGRFLFTGKICHWYTLLWLLFLPMSEKQG